MDLFIFSDICHLDIGIGFFGGAGNQPYHTELEKNLHSCRGRCLQDPRCTFVGFRPEGDVNMCYLYGTDFDQSALEMDESSLIYHKKCPFGELFYGSIYFFRYLLS